MENNNKVKVKFKLDEDHFIFLEIEESKLPIVKENNREVARLEKRKIRHESIYSLEAITEENGVEMIDGTTDISVTINLRNKDKQQNMPNGIRKKTDIGKMERNGLMPPRFVFPYI